MNTKHSFIPEKEAAFQAFATAFVAAAAAHAADLGIPQTLVTTLQTGLAAYNTAYAACENPNAGKIDREDRREKRAALTTTIRKFKNAYIDPDPLGAVTPEVRLEFSLPLKDAERTEIADPTDEVAFELRHGEYGQVIVVHPARPAGYTGALALYKVVPPGGPAPLFADLNQSRLLTRTHEIMEFPDTQIGHTLYLTLMWQLERGGTRGPAGPVQAIVLA